MASKLDQWVATLSRGTLATLAIGAGILFIVFSNPPRSVCHSQIEYLKEQQRGFLFSREDAKFEFTPSIKKSGESCRQADTPGACYELFSKMRILMRDLQTVPKECASRVGKLEEIKNAMWSTVRLMTNSAWGKAPPSSFQEKYGWLDQADIALYCSLKFQIIRFYGESEWASYRETLFTSLPGAKDLQRKEVWEKMLLSEDCRSY